MKKSFIILILLTLLSVPSSTFANETDSTVTLDKATQLYNKAIDLYKSDKTDESIELFKKAIELNPQFYEAYYNLAQILMSLNQDEEAYKTFLEIAKLRPNDGENIYSLGRVQYKRGYLASSYSYLKTIEKSAAQYESAKLLMQKIEKRQEELNLEAILKEHKNIIDEQGKAKGVEIAEYEAPSGVAIDSRGNIFSASYTQNAIYKISITGQKNVFSKSALIKGPIGIAIDKNNNIYIANYGANNIIKITPNWSASVFADVQKPYCITYDSIHDRLYVTEQNTNKVIKFDL